MTRTKFWEEVKNEPDLKTLIEELEERWRKEQHKRHEFWANIDENKKAEFINGEIIYHSPVYGRHWMASSNLLAVLLPYVKDKELGKVGVEKVMIRLTRNDYEPDICFWSKEKAQFFEQKQSVFPPPDFVVEILSDSTEDRDRGIKFRDYALHKVSEYWIVDVENETIEQYVLQNDTYFLQVKLKQGLLSSIAITDFSISVEEMFK
ncbi:MAG: Uma2 family endonuclease [Thermoflexibacter sp.]|nr:Uma2 family endonuclease [Thermoflexibacter sp.]